MSSGRVDCGLCGEIVVDCVTLTGCAHSFCDLCLSKWLDDHEECPTCGRSAPRNDKTTVKKDLLKQAIAYIMAPNTWSKEMRGRARMTLSDAERKLIFDRQVLNVQHFTCQPKEEVSIVFEYRSPRAIFGQQAVDDVEDIEFKRYFSCLGDCPLSAFHSLFNSKLLLPDCATLHFIHPATEKILPDEIRIMDIIMENGSWNRAVPFRICFTIVFAVPDIEPPPLLEMETLPPQERSPSPPPVFPLMVGPNQLMIPPMMIQLPFPAKPPPNQQTDQTHRV